MEIQKTTHSIRQLKKFPAAVRDELNAAIDDLQDWPDVENIKRLQNRADYRLKVGRYRIIFAITQNVIWITQILIRNDNTY